MLSGDYQLLTVKFAEKNEMYLGSGWNRAVLMKIAG